MNNFYSTQNYSKDLITTHALLNIEYNAIFAYSYIFHNFFKNEYLNINRTKDILNIIYEETTHFLMLEEYLKQNKDTFYKKSSSTIGSRIHESPDIERIAIHSGFTRVKNKIFSFILLKLILFFLLNSIYITLVW